MSDGNLRQLRVLHLVSSGGVTGSLQQSLFMPLLTRMPKQRVKTQVVSLAPGFAPAAVLRQNGVPVHDVALSKRRFSWGAFRELLEATRQFRPDVIQAWGLTARLAALFVRARCEWKPKIVWSIADTAPLPKNAGLIDRQKLKFTGKYSDKADRIVYTSEAAASMHRRVGYPEGGHAVVPPGVDPMRFKPDFAARRKVREQLGLEPEAFVIGMIAPFQAEHDHATLIKGVGELIKTHPHLCVILAGHGVQKGNGPLMALVGGGTLGTRTQLLGDWSDVASFFNACDIACSSSLTDSGRMTLVMAMLCGVPCVATGMGAQGEVIGQFGVAIEPGSPVAFVRGITRVMQMPQDRRAFMAQGARKHALTNFVQVRSLQKYLQLYFDIVGRQALAAEAVPTQEIDEAIPPMPEEMRTAKTAKPAANAVAMNDLSDPDSLEARVPVATFEYKRKPEPEPPPPPVEPKPQSDGDVLQIFESSLSSSAPSQGSVMTERARGVAEDLGDLLAPEMLQVAEPAAPQAPVIPALVSPPVEVPSVEVKAPDTAEPETQPVLTLASEDSPLISADLPTQQQASLPFDLPPQPDPEPALQLELLADPPQERKRAVGESG